MVSLSREEILATLRQDVARLWEKEVVPTGSGDVAAAPKRSMLGEVAMEPLSELVEENFPSRNDSVPRSFPQVPAIELPDGDKELRWNYLRNLVLNCPVCNAHVRPGKRIVFGVGNLDADIFFCGEAPGAEEEIAGEPFVGRAGQLLIRMISAMGLQRSQVYIGNTLNWRPEVATERGNRPPTQEEMDFCLPYLQGQLDIIQPKVIVALGAIAIRGLLGLTANCSVREMRGRWHFRFGVPVRATYHPSYLLRITTNATKRLVWEDLLQVMERVQLPISPQQRDYFL